MAEIKGMDKLLKQLKALDSELPEKIDKVIAANGSEIARNAKRFAPFNFGTLRKSIRRRKVEDMEHKVTVGVPYGAYMEFGTGGLVNVPEELKDVAIQFKGRGVKRINIRPRPFLWPAFVLQRDRVIKDLQTLLNKTINKI